MTCQVPNGGWGSVQMLIRTWKWAKGAFHCLSDKFWLALALCAPKQVDRGQTAGDEWDGFMGQGSGGQQESDVWKHV